MSNKLHIWLIVTPLVLSLVIILVIGVLLRFLPTKLPLFYSLAWGEAQLATHQQFLIIPASITLIALLNLIISWQLHPQQVFFKKVLLSSSLIISLILTVAFVKIILNFI